MGRGFFLYPEYAYHLRIDRMKTDHSEPDRACISFQNRDLCPQFGKQVVLSVKFSLSMEIHTTMCYNEAVCLAMFDGGM
jgi:hypothetical protein